MHEYFPRPSPDCPTFDGDSEWRPVVDGTDYFAELDVQLEGLQAGDEVLIGGLSLDAELDLTGKTAGTPGHRGFVDRLAALGAAGVDVRVLLAGKAAAFLLPPLGDFRANVALCHRINSATGMSGHALVDYSGPILGSNHQKTVVVTRGDEITAFVGGIDLVSGRFDAEPHTRLELDGERWGWHDMAVRLRGPAAARAHDMFLSRWHEAATLPARLWSGGRKPVNPPAAPAPPAAREQKPITNDQVAVRVVRSISDRKLDSVLPWRRVTWDALPPTGVQEIFETLTNAISSARRFVYIEDQYLHEYAAGRKARFELYPYLRDAAARGVKVVLVGSGTRDPEDPGLNLFPINRWVNRDIRTKIFRRLAPEGRGNVALYRIEHATMHSKLMVVDDVFAHIGSANLFSRSMSGVDCEIGSAVETSTSLVRDLRVRVWAEHLRAPLTPQLTADLEDLDLALGIFDPTWLPAARPATTWRTAGQPAGYAPTEHVLTRVDSR